MNERILATGTIVAGGDVQWRISPPPIKEQPVDGALQDLIDFEGQALEYEEAMEDESYWRSGQW